MCPDREYAIAWEPDVTQRHITPRHIEVPTGGPHDVDDILTRPSGTLTPAVTLPLLGSYGSGFTVTATHTEIIDPFRDIVGDPGQVADCA